MFEHQVVYKYPVPLQDEFDLELPKTAELLHFAAQGDDLCLWARVWLGETETITRRFRLAGTGHILESPPIRDLGTVLLEDGKLVLHLFEMWILPEAVDA